jgi:hypothetical protein
MWSPFSEFPRELAYPARAGIVYSIKEFLEKINIHNRRTTCFTSLYAFDKINFDGKPDYDSARITHIFIDLDNGQSRENIVKLHDYLMKNDLLHTMFFSGGGYHCYVATKYPNFLKNKKSAIFNAVTDVSDKVGLKIGINEHSDIDAHTVGNIAQLVRVPNTWNFKRKKYCIPINETHLQSLQELEYSYDHQNNWVTNYGHEYLDLESYDREPDVKYRMPEVDYGDSIGIENININSFLPCIKRLLTEKFNKGHRHRFYIITYCKELGLPLKDTIMLLKKYLEPRVYHHCCTEERQPIFIYRRGDLCFPSCQKLKQEGLCFDNNCRARA